MDSPDAADAGVPELSGGRGARSEGIAGTVSKNITLSVARVAVNTLVALVLPAYLTHRLPPAVYGAWVLILQLGAYVSFLDFGVQTGVAKFVAEYEAKGDMGEAGRHASAGFAMMTLAGLLGAVMTCLLAWQVPHLFHNMPSALYRDVRISVLLVGLSLSLGLVFTVFSGIFLGLQRYMAPMAIAVFNRVSFSVVVLAAVALHGSLVQMSAAVAAVNVLTAILQVAAWRRGAAFIRVSPALMHSHVLRRMTRYCATLSVWMLGALFVSGLDVTIVGHYDYGQTAFYSVAALPVNFLIVLLGAVFGPFMPAASALSTRYSAEEMGLLLGRMMRYCTAFLLLTGLPLLVLGYPILRVWVGPVYAHAGLLYLRILVVANIGRYFFHPYGTMLAATGRQGAANIAAVVEAVVNLGCSVYLAGRYGAVGVAWGTLIGSFVIIVLHFMVSMRFTRETLAISRARLLQTGILRPAVMALPSLVLLPFLWRSSFAELSLRVIALWGLSTLLIVWFVVLNADDRRSVARFVSASSSG